MTGHIPMLGGERRHETAVETNGAEDGRRAVTITAIGPRWAGVDLTRLRA